MPKGSQMAVVHSIMWIPARDGLEFDAYAPIGFQSDFDRAPAADFIDDRIGALQRFDRAVEIDGLAVDPTPFVAGGLGQARKCAGGWAELRGVPESKCAIESGDSHKQRRSARGRLLEGRASGSNDLERIFDEGRGVRIARSQDDQPTK